HTGPGQAGAHCGSYRQNVLGVVPPRALRSLPIRISRRSHPAGLVWIRRGLRRNGFADHRRDHSLPGTLHPSPTRTHRSRARAGPCRLAELRTVCAVPREAFSMRQVSILGVNALRPDNYWSTSLSELALEAAAPLVPKDGIDALVCVAPS